MDKTMYIKAKQNRITGLKKEGIGISTGILCSNDRELLSGDLIDYYGEMCVVLYNRHTKKFEAMILRSCCYNERDFYNPACYGKSYRLLKDNGAKNEIKYICSEKIIIQNNLNKMMYANMEV